MKKIISTLLISLLSIIIITLVTAKIIATVRFKNTVKELFSSSPNSPDKTFSYDQLTGLPGPVQRYFKYALKEGQPLISYVRLKHGGRFKIDQKKDWMDIKGEQYFTIQNPGFIWKGRIAIITAQDMFINHKGLLLVTLLSLFNIIDVQGDTYDHSELLRWLVENVWFPTSFLPHDNLQWTAIDSHTAGLSFTHQDISLYVKVSFNDKGQITRLESKRYMTEDTMETWIGICSNYQEFNGVKVPTSVEILWDLETGPFSYAQFHVQELEYNISEQY